MEDIFWTALKIGAALGAALIIYLIGAGMVRNFAQGEMPINEPEIKELQDVDYRYQCVVCGSQAVLFAAPEGDPPEAPRHCRESMMLLTPTD